MYTNQECLRCIGEDVLTIAKWLLRKRHFATFEKKIEKYLNDINYRRIPSYHITHVHRILKSFHPRIERLIARRRVTNRQVKKYLKKIARPTFAQKIRWAVWANSLDFRTAGVGYQYKNFASFYKKLNQQLAVDERRAIIELINKSKNILYILDNVGEIGFDRLPIETISKNRKITCVVRGGIMTSDVTREDAKYFKIDKVAKIITSGPDTLGLLKEELSKELKQALKRCDLVIAKGQANYYFFSEYRKITKAKVVNLFTTKCNSVAERFGKKGKVGIATII